MTNDRLLSDTNYKGYRIAVYLTEESDRFDSTIFDNVNGDDPITTFNFLKRDEAVIIAQAFIEGMLYNMKTDTKEYFVRLNTKECTP
jgi:hypothetical protein